MFGSGKREQLAAERADVSAWQARLGSDVSSLDAGVDPVSRQALADAAERYTAAGGILSSATTVGELQVAKRIVVEGLTATRLVRGKQGLPLGPDLPADPRAVDQPTPVTYDGDHYTAHPVYHPEQPHYFDGGDIGGASTPAGYYRTPFWKKALAVGGAVVAGEMIGNAVSGIFDGGERQGFGGGFGGGFDNDNDGGFDGGGFGGGGDW